MAGQWTVDSGHTDFRKLKIPYLCRAAGRHDEIGFIRWSRTAEQDRAGGIKCFQTGKYCDQFK